LNQIQWEGPIIPWPPHSLDSFFCLSWKSVKCEWVAWQNCQTAECVTNEILANAQ
jgi:hypothetical protein